MRVCQFGTLAFVYSIITVYLSTQFEVPTLLLPGLNFLLFNAIGM